MKSHAEQIARRCVHFTGLSEKSGACAAGVVYATVKNQQIGGPQAFPCFRDGEANPCEKRRFPTKDEVDKEVAEHEASFKRLELAIGAASKDAKSRGLGKGNGGAGAISCPVCKTGTLNYTVASYNGHMWGRCTTAECMCWMQ